MASKLRLAANITHMFTEYDLPDRIKAAADCGFGGVEILSPYDFPAPDLRDKAVWAGVQIVLINAPPPNYTDQPQGFAAMPDRIDRFRRDFLRAQRYAQVLGARRIHVMAGTAQGPDAKQCFIDNLSWACAESPKLELSIEPLNGVDFPGYFLNDFALARNVIEAVKAPNLSLQYDTYHAQMITQDALGIWTEVKDIVGHIQLGDAPGRGAPGSGDINFASLFAAIRESGYAGWISGEYKPGGTTKASLDWMQEIIG